MLAIMSLGSSYLDFPDISLMIIERMARLVLTPSTIEF
jgi:hypothetical protein